MTLEYLRRDKIGKLGTFSVLFTESAWAERISGDEQRQSPHSNSTESKTGLQASLIIIHDILAS
jgi:hypothetical protein